MMITGINYTISSSSYMYIFHGTNYMYSIRPINKQYSIYKYDKHTPTTDVCKVRHKSSEKGVGTNLVS